MAKNEKKLNEKISKEIDKYGTLKDSFLLIYDSETEVSKSRNDAYDEIYKIEEKDNVRLREIYVEFIKRMKELEDDRKRHLEKIMSLILPVTVYYPDKLKETEKNLANLSDLRKQKDKDQKEIDKAKVANEVNKVQELNAAMAKKSQDEKKEGARIENAICTFEKDRVNDNKCLFLQYIYSELRYHALALEKMSNLFNNINSTEPREELIEFAKNYGIKNYKKILGDLKIDIESIKARQEQAKKMEEKKKTMFYTGVDNSKIENSNMDYAN